MLQVSMIHAAHHHWPKTRFQKYACSYWLPLYQATQNSIRYALPTTSDVNSVIAWPRRRAWLIVT